MAVPCMLALIFADVLFAGKAAIPFQLKFSGKDYAMIQCPLCLRIYGACGFTQAVIDAPLKLELGR